MKTKSKPKKYHYTFTYKKGNYFQVSRGLEKRYAKYLAGSGTMLDFSQFDVSFICTAKQYKNIVACARRRYGRSFKVSRDEV